MILEVLLLFPLELEVVVAFVVVDDNANLLRLRFSKYMLQRFVISELRSKASCSLCLSSVCQSGPTDILGCGWGVHGFDGGCSEFVWLEEGRGFEGVEVICAEGSFDETMVVAGDFN